MAYRGYNVVCFTPAGRKRTMSILLDYLELNRDIIDEYQVWLNTDDDQVEDDKWLRTLPKKYDWVKLIERPNKEKPLSPKQMNTGLFYAHNTVDPNTIYIRFDDDIVYIDDDYFPNMLDFRIDNPDYFLVMGHIWNNATTSYIGQQLGTIPQDEYTVEEPYCMEPTAWRDGGFAEMIHNVLFDHIQDGTTDELWFDRADLKDATRFSISNFCFFGRDFAKFDGVIGQLVPGIVSWDEEVWLTEIYTQTEGLLNAICGSALVSHYSFFAQRPYLDKTDVLATYRQLAQDKLSRDYYKLLDESNERQKGKTTEERSSRRPEGLRTIQLPQNQRVTETSQAMAALKVGFKVESITDNELKVTYQGKQVASVSGRINGYHVDKVLSRLLRKHRSKL